MRSNALLLAVSLFSTGNVLAGPCKPQGSRQASISYGTTTATVLESTALPLSETITSSDALTTTSSDATTITGSDALTTTGSDATTTTLVSIDTTALSSDAESSATAATTTTAPAPQGTFALRGAGGSVTNAQPQGSDQPGSIIFFNSASSDFEIRHYNIETTTGRLQDAISGHYICAYYGDVDKTTVPPYVANCDPASTGPDKIYKYLDCRVIGSRLSCTTPSTALCYYDDASRDYICASEPENEAYNQFFYKDIGGADAWYISRGSPDGWTAMELFVSAA
ncbi:hypothetical protein KAF25_002368 [Fusarium avenaceum]|uniref:Uncharacterized protein n=1 Tax=Fusarium avenaceum TaxID=40199 RepID=A0A9P7H132_9HYPO|nr:hypothetical protein KAF25_002368 [Fusarium avenaceum]